MAPRDNDVDMRELNLAAWTASNILERILMELLRGAHAPEGAWRLVAAYGATYGAATLIEHAWRKAEREAEAEAVAEAGAQAETEEVDHAEA